MNAPNVPKLELEGLLQYQTRCCECESFAAAYPTAHSPRIPQPTAHVFHSSRAATFYPRRSTHDARPTTLVPLPSTAMLPSRPHDRLSPVFQLHDHALHPCLVPRMTHPHSAPLSIPRAVYLVGTTDYVGSRRGDRHSQARPSPSGKSRSLTSRCQYRKVIKSHQSSDSFISPLYTLSSFLACG